MYQPCFEKMTFNASAKSDGLGQSARTARAVLGRRLLLLITFLRAKEPVYLTIELVVRHIGLNRCIITGI